MADPVLDRPASTIAPTQTTIGFVEDVLPTLLSWRRAGIASALVSVVGVDGSSPRPVGSQMAVAIDGRFVGQISSGCAEQAIVEEAVACLQSATNRLVRYGKGSPYLDIVLPCGSGIDIFFDTQIKTSTVANVISRLDARQPGMLVFDLEALTSRAADDAATTTDFSLANKTWTNGNTVYKRFAPQIRLLAFGRGTIVGALTQVGNVLGFETHTFAPDQETLAYAAQSGAQTATHLTTPDGISENISKLTDPWTAAVLMFHDHDWEPPLLQHLLATDCFYIGAIGSHRTHAQRLEVLEEDLGCDPAELRRIKGPVGLDIGAQNPPEIALSIVAEVLQHIRNDGRPHNT